MRLITLTLVCLGIIVGSNHAQTSKTDAPPTKTTAIVPLTPNATCPVMGKPISTKLFVDTKFGRIYVCCIACNKKIRQDPEGMHKAAYPKVEKVGNTTCPVSGVVIKGDAQKVLLQGREINLCCKDCVKPAQDNAQVTLAKALNPALKDLGNQMCPVTETAIEKNTIVVIDGSIVHLSSAKCIEQVQQDPAAALKKAKASAPAEKSPESKPAEKKPAESGHENHKHN